MFLECVSMEAVLIYISSRLDGCSNELNKQHVSQGDADDDDAYANHGD